MTDNNKVKSQQIHIAWLLSPYLAIILAFIAWALNDNTGMDGAARATAMVFWYLPLILFVGYKSSVELVKTKLSKWAKILFFASWFIPSVPIGFISLFGILLITETGLSIIF